MTLPVRKSHHLRFQRVSLPGANYFLTFATQGRSPVLTAPETAKLVCAVFQDLHFSKDIELLAATLMPDHVHLLFTVGARLTVGQIMGKLKSLSCDHDRDAWQWQKEGFEHRIRSHESLEDYAFYIFMNPYRAGLCPPTGRWAWWICPEPKFFRFLDLLNDGQAVPHEWLDRSDQIAANIEAGTD